MKKVIIYALKLIVHAIVYDNYHYLILSFLFYKYPPIYKFFSINIYGTINNIKPEELHNK